MESHTVVFFGELVWANISLKRKGVLQRTRPQPKERNYIETKK
jgi:hypothetical protein